MKLNLGISLLVTVAVYGQGVSWDLSAIQAYREDATGQWYSLIPGVESRSTPSPAQGPLPFSAFLQGTYRMDGVLGPAGDILHPASGSFSSADGLTVRLVLTTKAYTGNPGTGKQLLRFATTDQSKLLFLGHDDQSWILGRSFNASPKDPLLDPLKSFWTTPWDPVYDVPETTVIVYYRIAPNGVTYIDRFMPYYDSGNVFRLSWEEGVQLGAWTVGTLGMGAQFSNPAVPAPVTFTDGYIGGANVTDLIRSIRMKSASIPVGDMFNDVIHLIPEAATVLTSADMKPCNDGLWLMKQVHQTPCGPFTTYTPAAGPGTHWGPPANRADYKTGISSTFAPPAVTISAISVGSGVRFTWQNPVNGLGITPQGYNYAVLDTTIPNLIQFIDGGTTTETSYTVAGIGDHKYTLYVAPYNDMGVGPSNSLQATFIPPGPAGSNVLCAYEGGTCTLSNAIYVSFGTRDNFITRYKSTNVSCTVASFGGDPAPGYPKACYAYVRFTKPSGPHCAYEGGVCSLGGPDTVWFGTDGNWISRPMSTGVNCTASAMHFDPNPSSSNKECFTTPTKSTFSGPPGGFSFAATVGGEVRNSGPVPILLGEGVSGTAFRISALAPQGPGQSTICTAPYNGYLNSCFTYADSIGLAVLPPSYNYCAADGQPCYFTGPGYVAYGFAPNFEIKKFSNGSGGISCTGATFNVPSDPWKLCYVMPVHPGAP